MASRQPNTNWNNIPGTSQISWKTESKPACDCPHDDVNSYGRSKSDAGVASGHDCHPVQNRYASFSSASSSSPVSHFSSPNQSRSASVATSVSSSRSISHRPSLVDMVKTLPPVLETSSGTRFNAATFATNLDNSHSMRERHQKIRSAIETLESIIRFEEDEERQRQQQRLLEQQRILEQQRLQEQQRQLEQQRLQEQQRQLEQQRLQEQQRQQQYTSNNDNWNQNTNTSYARNGSISVFDEIQAEHDQRAYEASIKKEEHSHGRKFSLFKSKKHPETANAIAETRERKPSEWSVPSPQFRERESSVVAGMGDGGGWYGAAAERKASVVSMESNMRKASIASMGPNMRKGSTASMASNFRKGSTAGMPKTRRPSDWGSSMACLA